MAPLVGDLIMEMRALGPDLPQTLPAPTINSMVSATGGVLAPGTYFAVATALNEWGETLPSAEVSAAIAGTALSLSVTIAGGTIKIRVYLQQTAGGENFYQEFIGPFSSNPVTILVTGTPVTTAVPPQRNTAYLPDTDGGFVSASACYRWLNESLDAAARITEGIPSMGGATSTSGQRRYVMNGQWLRIDQAWFNGWELALGNKGDVFYNRNIMAGISNTLMVDEQSDTTRIELYWTPNVNGGQASTSGNMTASSTGVSITAPIGWQLDDGFILFGTPGVAGSYEICHYQSQNGAAINGLIRGYSGTQPQAWPSGTSVYELNIMISGYRMPLPYALGNSTLTLATPPAWKPILAKYMLAKFREAEQERQEAASLFKEFESWFMQYAKSNKQIAGPRQLRVFDEFGIRGVAPGGRFGLIIP